MADVAGAIIKGYRTWERKPHDLYPTPFDATESIMPVIKQIFPEGSKVWECACGDLDITRVLEWHGYEVTSTDIRDTGIIPQFEGFGGFDFLNDDPTEKCGWLPDPDLVFTNPPFNLAEAFVRKALTYTPNVALLLKIDYWSADSRFDLFDDHRPAMVIPLTFRPAFLKAERGNSPLMNVMWCIWTDRVTTGGSEYPAFSPARRRVYPGYQGPGLRSGMSKLVQAIDDLTEVISNGRSDT